MKNVLLFMAAFLMLPSLSSAVILDAGTAIKPNSTSSGHYVINMSFSLSSITVNDTHVTFISSANFTCNITGTDSQLCAASASCALPYNDSIVNINCSAAQAAVEQSGVGGRPATSVPKEKFELYQIQEEKDQLWWWVGFLSVAITVLIIGIGYMYYKYRKDKLGSGGEGS